MELRFRLHCTVFNGSKSKGIVPLLTLLSFLTALKWKQTRKPHAGENGTMSLMIQRGVQNSPKTEWNCSVFTRLNWKDSTRFLIITFSTSFSFCNRYENVSVNGWPKRYDFVQYLWFRTFSHSTVRFHVDPDSALHSFAYELRLETMQC